jgi:dipeptidase E
MKKIVAIGGGEIGRAGYSVETLEIDREIIRLTGKKNPRLLFIPTASSDSEGYAGDIQKHFGAELGCAVDVLFLSKEKYSKRQLEEKILNSDIIYVGGGNTLKMMKTWRRLGVDKILKLAYNRGIVLAGVSAGAICWFDSGHSNSLFYYDPKHWRYINVKGLGLIKGIFCPHYNGEVGGAKRAEYFSKMIKKTGGIGLAVENQCALEFIDGKYFKVLTSAPGAAAFQVYKKRGEVVTKKIKQKKVLAPVSELYRK